MASSKPDYPALVAELVGVQAQLAPLTERAEEIKDQLRELGKGRHVEGAFTVSVVPNRRLSQDAVMAAYPVDTHAHFYKSVVNTDAVKALVEPAVYDAMLIEVGKAKISVR